MYALNVLFALDDALFILGGKGIEFLFLFRIACFTKQGKRSLFAFLNARLIKGVDIEHCACVSSLKLEQEQELTEGKGIQFGKPKRII